MDEKTISSLESRLTLYSVLFWIIILYGSVSILLSAFVIFSRYEITYLNFVLLIMSLVTVSMIIIALHALHKRSKFVPFAVITALVVSLPTTVFVFPVLLALIAALVYGVYLFVFNRDMKELLSGQMAAGAARMPKPSPSERFVSTLSIYYLLLGIGACIMTPLAFFASGIGNPTGIEAVLVRTTLFGLFAGAIIFFVALRALRVRKPSAPYLVYVSCLLTLAIAVIVFYGNGPSSALLLLSFFGPPLFITAYGSFIFLFNKDVKALFVKSEGKPEVKS